MSAMTQGEVAGEVPAGSPALLLGAFGFAYPDQQALFEQLNWCVRQGEFVALCGTTGAGKTSLLRCLKPELMPGGAYHGSRLIFGLDLQAREAPGLVALVGAQDEGQLVCERVIDELSFGLEHEGCEPGERRMRLADLVHRLGLEPLLHRPCAELSSGQRQLVALASALVLRPRLLLLDEPTALLDVVMARRLVSLVSDLNREQDITVVYATHGGEELVGVADRFCRLEGGRIEEMPEPSPLRPLSPYLLEDTSPQHSSELLHWRGVEFGYEPGISVITDLDLSIGAGRIHAVIGGNGSGKTTLLKLGAGLLKARRGRLLNRARDRQAFLPSNPTVLFVRDSVDDELAEWAETFGYDACEIECVKQDLGLANLGSRHPFDLSSGQRQLVALAKLLLTRPALLWLDEPSRGLSPGEKCELGLQLRRISAEGVTVVLASHDLSFACLVADELSVIFDGSIAATLSPRRFVELGLYYRAWEDGFARQWLEPAADPDESYVGQGSRPYGMPSAIRRRDDGKDEGHGSCP